MAAAKALTVVATCARNTWHDCVLNKVEIKYIKIKKKIKTKDKKKRGIADNHHRSILFIKFVLSLLLTYVHDTKSL